MSSYRPDCLMGLWPLGREHLYAAIAEAIFLEKPSGAHDAFVGPLGSFVNVFGFEVYCPGFVGKHANLLVQGFVFDEIVLFVLLLPFLSVFMLVVF